MGKYRINHRTFKGKKRWRRAQEKRERKKERQAMRRAEVVDLSPPWWLRAWWWITDWWHYDAHSEHPSII